jgi:hypothetical protein
MCLMVLFLGKLVLFSGADNFGRRLHMRKRILVALLLFSLGSCAFAADKARPKTLTPSKGILIPEGFQFPILGDGISTNFAITPWRIPQGGGGALTVPLLPLVGVLSSAPEDCQAFPVEISFTATVSGRQVLITLSSPPSAGEMLTCSVTLLFAPE